MDNVMDSARAEAERTARVWEAMARILCDLAGSDPDFIMWDGQPLWKWRMHGTGAKAQIQAAIDALNAPRDGGDPDAPHRWI